jgi:hypothetical protein
MFRDCVVYVLLCYFDCSNGWLEHLFWSDIFYIHWCVNLFLALYLDLFEYIKYEYEYVPMTPTFNPQDKVVWNVA